MAETLALRAASVGLSGFYFNDEVGNGQHKEDSL
jgi:hypothetical protein